MTAQTPAWSPTFHFVPTVPLIGGDRYGFPDPRVMSDGLDFYITGTGEQCYHARTFQKNTLLHYHLDFDFKAEAKRVQMIWSLSLYRHTDGSYHAYATLNYGGFNTSIGHFVPQPGTHWSGQTPITRWRLDRVLVPNAYDPIAVREVDGTPYLIYAGTPPKMKGNRHIMAWRMNDPGTLDPSFEPRAILSPEKYRSEDRGGLHGGQLVEAPTISRIQGKYVMLYSVGNFEAGNYKLGVGFSDTLIPPEGQTYQKLFAPDPQNIWGSNRKKEILYLLQSEKPMWPNYSGAHLQAPGSGNLVQADGKYFLVFHARRPGPIAQRPRCTWVMPVQVNIQPNIPPEQWIRIP